MLYLLIDCEKVLRVFFCFENCSADFFSVISGWMDHKKILKRPKKKDGRKRISNGPEGQTAIFFFGIIKSAHL